MNPEVARGDLSTPEWALPEVCWTGSDTYEGAKYSTYPENEQLKQQSVSTTHGGSRRGHEHRDPRKLFGDLPNSTYIRSSWSSPGEGESKAGSTEVPSSGERLSVLAGRTNYSIQSHDALRHARDRKEAFSEHDYTRLRREFQDSDGREKWGHTDHQSVLENGRGLREMERSKRPVQAQQAHAGMTSFATTHARATTDRQTHSVNIKDHLERIQRNHRGWKRIVDGVAKETARGCEVWEWNGRRILFEPSRRQHKMESQAGEEAATKKVGRRDQLENAKHSIDDPEVFRVSPSLLVDIRRVRETVQELCDDMGTRFDLHTEQARRTLLRDGGSNLPVRAVSPENLSDPPRGASTPSAVSFAEELPESGFTSFAVAQGSSSTPTGWAGVVSRTAVSNNQEFKQSVPPSAPNIVPSESCEPGNEIFQKVRVDSSEHIAPLDERTTLEGQSGAERYTTTYASIKGTDQRVAPSSLGESAFTAPNSSSNVPLRTAELPVACVPLTVENPVPSESI